MEPFKKHTGKVAPLDRINVDTDAIIPKQFLRKIDRVGYGKHLFHEWRYLDYEGTKENPEFVLNKPPYRKATILLTRDNFGCGSSREHAPWALNDFGFKAIIAPSFADIFANNCTKNGIVLVPLKPEEVNHLFEYCARNPGGNLTVDLNDQCISTPDNTNYHFEINSFAKNCLLKGLDHIGWTLQFEDKIKMFEEKLKNERPWLSEK